MPTPIGHALSGAVVYAVFTKGKHLLKLWKWLVVCMVFAALADIDFIPALFGRVDIANRIHRGPTHSLLFAVVVGVAAFGVMKALGKPRPVRSSVVLFFCLLSHILLDLMGKDYRPPIGVPVLWPFVARSVRIPVGVFLDLHKDTYAEIVSLYNVRVFAHEVMVFGSILSILVVFKLWYASKKGRLEDHGGVVEVSPDRTQ